MNPTFKNPYFQEIVRLLAHLESTQQPALLRAARNRRFAAACALVPYALTSHAPALTVPALWQIARARRAEVLLTPVTRPKTRIAAALTLAGLPLWQRAMSRYLSRQR